MKTKSTPSKPKTISELCGQPPGSFAAFLESEKAELQAAQKAADERLRNRKRKPANPK